LVDAPPALDELVDLLPLLVLSLGELFLADMSLSLDFALDTREFFPDFAARTAADVALLGGVLLRVVAATVLDSNARTFCSSPGGANV
jgi:hypothetical protein